MARPGSAAPRAASSVVRKALDAVRTGGIVDQSCGSADFFLFPDCVARAAEPRLRRIIHAPDSLPPLSPRMSGSRRHPRPSCLLVCAALLYLSSLRKGLQKLLDLHWSSARES